jgi:UDP-N-acetylglucosamine transferase subunit ALG13
LNPNKKTILVIGGSQGAHGVNQAVLRALLGGVLPDGYQLLWQTGKREYTEVSAAAGDKARGHTLFPFENRMDLVYAAADIAIARAGAITLAELEACALPAVLIPYPFAAGDHQRKNAEEFVRQGFAIMIDEQELASTNPVQVAVSAVSSGQAVAMRAGIRKAIEGSEPEKRVALYQQFSPILSGPLSPELAKTIRHLHALGVAPQERLQELGLDLPDLAGSFSENLKRMGKELSSVQEVVQTLKQDSEAKDLVYPVALIFGSKLKG